MFCIFLIVKSNDKTETNNELVLLLIIVCVAKV